MASSSFADRPISLSPPPAPRRRLLIGAAVAVVFLLAALAAVLLPGSGGHAAPAERFTAGDRSFSVAVPNGWFAMRPAELKAVPGAPAAVLRSADGRGVVVVNSRPALARNSRSLTRDLTAQLGRRFAGMKPVTARTVALRGGPAYVYTFARPAAARVQSIVVAPRGNHTYTLDAVAGAGATDVAAQVGAIVRSFDTTNPAPRS
jgi:hypothetical protein